MLGEFQARPRFMMDVPSSMICSPKASTDLMSIPPLSLFSNSAKLRYTHNAFAYVDCHVWSRPDSSLSVGADRGIMSWSWFVEIVGERLSVIGVTSLMSISHSELGSGHGR